MDMCIYSSEIKAIMQIKKLVKQHLTKTKQIYYKNKPHILLLFIIIHHLLTWNLWSCTHLNQTNANSDGNKKRNGSFIRWFKFNLRIPCVVFRDYHNFRMYNNECYSSYIADRCSREKKIYATLSRDTPHTRLFVVLFYSVLQQAVHCPQWIVKLL